MRNLSLAVLALALLSGAAQAKEYKVEKEASCVAFSGTHAGTVFHGVFEEWSAVINFDPDALASSYVKATFKPASAKTGNKMYDGTLPSIDWFDTANHAEATFSSTAISANVDGSYTATGDLTIRGITHPVAFTFTLSNLEELPVIAKGGFIIDRLSYDVGKKSDGAAEWVSKEIPVTLEITAVPAK